jgi:hypothetical protein
MVFLVETADEPSARSLLDIAKRKKPSDDGVLALTEGRLFCLLVARAGFGGSKNEESSESVRRFSAGLSEILQRYVKR